jgi:hypothetical protein
VSLLLTISRHTSDRLAEVAFLLILIAGVWMAADALLPPRWHKVRMVVAGVLFAVAGLIMIIVIHSGHFG